MIDKFNMRRSGFVGIDGVPVGVNARCQESHASAAEKACDRWFHFEEVSLMSLPRLLMPISVLFREASSE
jgi:hypothetical protein